MSQTLKDVLPYEFMGGEYVDTPAYKLRDQPVVQVHEVGWNWPGPHKNICRWVVLDNGKAVGWNENVSRGWSFPVIKYKG